MLLDSLYGPVQVYKTIREDLATGGRAFIVCPLVEASKNEATADLAVLPTSAPAPAMSRRLAPADHRPQHNTHGCAMMSSSGRLLVMPWMT